VVCSLPLYAQTQVIELDDGRVVRYFTESQLIELAEQLEERDQCLELVSLKDESIERHLAIESELDYQIDLLSERNDSLSAEIDAINDRRFLFCRDSECAMAVGVVIGVVGTMTLLQMSE